jgi:hypothetical protein
LVSAWRREKEGERGPGAAAGGVGQAAPACGRAKIGEARRRLNVIRNRIQTDSNYSNFVHLKNGPPELKKIK